MLAELFANSPQQINTEIIAHKRLQPHLNSQFKIKQHPALLGLKLLMPQDAPSTCELFPIKS